MKAMAKICGYLGGVVFALTLTACSAQRQPPIVPPNALADAIIVNKSARTLTLLAHGRTLAIYHGIRLGGAPHGQKQAEGDERTPEGPYRISGRNPNSRYHLSLRISYPDAKDMAAARAAGHAPGGDIFIHGQPNWLPIGQLTWDWTDGCIALSNAEMDQVWRLVPVNTPITILP